jgi:hypothetical protein
MTKNGIVREPSLSDFTPKLSFRSQLDPDGDVDIVSNWDDKKCGKIQLPRGQFALLITNEERLKCGDAIIQRIINTQRPSLQ